MHPHDVFISYSSKDVTVAQTVCAVMEREGLRCWVAPRDVTPGADWAQSIVRGISGARVFLLIFSSFANTSDQIKREVERAANRGIPIIPFRIDEVRPNETLEYFISTPHWLDALTPPLEEHALRLAETVKRLLQDEMTIPSPAAETPEPEAASPTFFRSLSRATAERRRRLLFGGLALVVVLAMGAVAASRLNPPDASPQALSAPTAATASRAQGWAGLGLLSVDEQIAQAAGLPSAQGAYVTELLRGPARAAGLQRGDIILTIDNRRVTDAESAIQRLEEAGPGTTISLAVLRGTQSLAVPVQLASRPIDLATAQIRPPTPERVTAASAPLRAQDFDVARLMDLRHYPATELWEFSVVGSDALVSYLIPEEGLPVRLDGRSKPIRDYNQRMRLDLDRTSTAAEYLRFYTAHVWAGEAGPFLLVESPNDLPPAVRGTPKAHYKPVSTQRVGEAFEAEAFTLHAGLLSDTRYRIHPDGTVEMTGDDSVAADLPRSGLYTHGQRRPVSLQGLLPNHWPTTPAIPGNWRDPTYAEFARARQLILSAEGRAR